MASSIPGRMPSAVLLATVPAADGGAAAALPADGRTILERLLAQLRDLGVGRTWVVTRPEWAADLERAVPAGRDVAVVRSADVGEDLQALAEIAGQVDGQLLVAAADVVLHQRVLAVMLADPPMRSGVLVTTPRGHAEQALRVRVAALRVVGAESAYHRIDEPNGYELGVVVVDPADLEQAQSAAHQAGALVADPPASWRAELDHKVAGWRASAPGAPAPHAVAAARLAVDGTGPISDTDTVGADPDVGAGKHRVDLDPEDEARLAWQVTVATHDPLPLVVVALLRSGVPLRPAFLRAYFYARPVDRDGAEHAVARLAERDEDALALASAVKATDGFFTTFFVSPYSRYIARFAARRGWTPNAMTIVSMLIGILSALAFAQGSRLGLVVGAILLQAAFTVDCVDGQLARYTLKFSDLGAWLDSTFDRAKEYVVYAGLAVGAARGFDQDVWTLAAAALTLQTFRHMLVFAFDGSRGEKLQAVPLRPLEDPDDRTASASAAAPTAAARRAGAETPQPATVGVATAPAPTAAAVVEDVEAPPRPKPALALRPVHAVGRLDRFETLRWVRRIWLLPIGERFALISITAAYFTPRTTFIALLVWGGATAVWNVMGRVLRSVAS